MLFGVVSDSHDHNDNMRKALQEMQGMGIKTVLHLGDICAPTLYFDVLKNFEDNMRFVMVFGNNDGEKIMWTKLSMENAAIDLADGDFRELELAGKKVFMTHYPKIAELAAKSGNYDTVFYGHDHKAYSEKEGNCLLANPGEIMGLKYGRPSYGIWDSEKNSFEIVYF